MSTTARTIIPVLASLVFASGAAWGQSGAGTRGASPDPRTNTPKAGAGLLVPASQPDPMLNNGCWIQLMDNLETPRSREYLTIIGAKYMPELETASGKGWARRADGLSIGPNAQVVVYGEKNYGGRGVAIRPNSIVQDLRAELGLVNSIESMKIDCRSS